MIGLTALKWMLRGNSDFGWTIPCSWLNVISSPRVSTPLSFQAAGNKVLFRRCKIRVSRLEKKILKLCIWILWVLHKNYLTSQDNSELTDLCNNTLPNSRTFLSTFNSGSTPWQQIGNNIGSGLWCSEQTKWSLNSPVDLGYAQIVRGY